MYNDVDQNAWYAQALALDTQLGLLTGYPDGTFRPDQSITRAEFAAALAKLVGNQLAIQRWNGQQLRAKTAPAVVYISTGKEIGSGVIVTPDGYVVTADHVIAGATQIEVTFPDWDNPDAPHGQDGPALNVIAEYPEVDLALCKINWDTTYPFVTLAATPPIPGEPVIMLGAPGGISCWESAGYVARPDLYLQYYTAPQELIPVAGAINPGNSGGALIRAANGKLLGINTMKFVDPQQGIEGMAFAVPAAVVRDKVKAVITI